MKFAINRYPFITLLEASYCVLYLRNVLGITLPVAVFGLTKIDPFLYKCLPVYCSHFCVQAIVMCVDSFRFKHRAGVGS
jgi:hypothetical protein